MMLVTRKESTTPLIFHLMMVLMMRATMEIFRLGVVVLQWGADSLSGDRIRCSNLSIKGHAECVKFMRSFYVPLLLLAGGCYTIQNVACCWCYEIGVALDVEVDDKMPQHEYYKYSGPDYTLQLLLLTWRIRNRASYLRK
ncbi:hypothetical protein AB3S75_013498 [Citrus x aurantiifolia]